MSFADELRSLKVPEEKIIDYFSFCQGGLCIKICQEDIVKLVVEDIRAECIKAKSEGNNFISGYPCIRDKTDDRGYYYDCRFSEEYNKYAVYFIDHLPSIEDEQKHCDSFNNRNYHAYESGAPDVRKPENRKRSHYLYDNCRIITAKDKTVADSLKEDLEKEIRNLGFSSFSVAVEEPYNYIIIENIHSSFLIEKLTMSITAQKTDHKYYVIRIYISW